MKINYVIPTVLLLISSLFISCEDDDSSEATDEGNEMTTAISVESVSGLLNSESFTPETIHFEKSQSFGDNGYNFKLYAEVEICDEFQSIGDITFFVESETTLTPGSYDASGPFFFFSDEDGSSSISFFGAEVIIETVSDDEIMGRVRGGDKDNENYIEGAFTAVLCQK